MAEFIPFNQKSRAASRLLMLSSVLGVVSLGFLIAAFNAWLKTQYPPEMASLITAGSVFALAVIIAIIAAIIMQCQRHRARAFKNNLKHTFQKAISTLDEELGDHVRDHPIIAVLLAGMAGAKVGDKVL